jgi:hypothetical protein
MKETSIKPGVKITALTIAQAAKILSTAYNRRITEEQVRRIAEAGNLLRADGTLNLLEYVAFLAREACHG